MKKMLSELRRDFILLSLSCIAIGALLLCFPETAGTMIAYLCAAVLVVYGALHIIAYCIHKVPGDVYRFDLVTGLIGLVLGIYICIRPELLVSFFPLVLGIVILVDSFVKLQNAIDLLRMEDKSWWFILLLSIVTGVLAVLMLANPFTTAELLLIFVGVSLIANGVIDLIAIFRLTHRIKRVTRTLQEEADALSSVEFTVTDAAQPAPAAEPVVEQPSADAGEGGEGQPSDESGSGLV